MSPRPTPELSKLETDYQILTELHRSDGAHTYLARHLVLNRDVTITVVRGENALALRQLAADAIRLTTSRHPNIVPVVEGRWLDAETFAVVHARVRGSTLDQLASAVDGTTPLARVGDTLRQVNDALTWARNNEVVHRHIIADDLIFQQGSGRVLVSLSPLPSVLHGAPEAVAALDQCADARTIGELAFVLLSGQPRGTSMQPLGAVRPDLPPAIVDGVQRLMRCTPTDRTIDVPAFLALFGAGTAAAAAAPAVVPVTPPPHDTTVVTVAQKRGMGFGGRFAMAVLVLILIAVGAFVWVNHDNTTETKIQASTTPSDSSTDAAGEIALRARQADSALRAEAPTVTVPTAPAETVPTPAIVQPSPVTPYPSQPVTPYPSQPVTPPAPTTSAPPAFTPLAPPTQRRPEPTRPVTPPVIIPPSSATPPDTTGAVSTGDVCDSPVSADQQRCLMASVARNDHALNDVYQQLISALRRQANVQPGDPDPQSVESLRGEQRRWLEDRDAQCHEVGSGALYARDRAACFADHTDARVRELQQRIDALPPASTASVPTDTVATDTVVTNSMHGRP